MVLKINYIDRLKRIINDLEKSKDENLDSLEISMDESSTTCSFFWERNRFDKQ